MALVVTIAGVNRTAIVEVDTIRISQLADTFTFTAELALFDTDSDVTIVAGSHRIDAGAYADEITIVDGATTYFGGFIANQDIETLEDGSRRLSLQCQGYGILLNEAIVEAESYSATADDAIIADLFDLLPLLDDTTKVAQIDASMDIDFAEMSLLECMQAICEQTGGRFYVDNIMQLHYFADEGEDAGFDLSDEPNDVTSFSYYDGVEKRENAAQIINRVRIVGADGLTTVRNDAGSQTTYGIRGVIIMDSSLTTSAELEARGDAILALWKNPKVTFIVRTPHDGAVAGNEIDFKCDEVGYNSISDGDDPLVIRELVIYWEQSVPVYEMLLGEAELLALTRADTINATVRSVVVSPNIPLASRGWAHDMVFSATDFNTVAWSGGTITLAGGVGTFSIDAGNTGNIADITYIYLDSAVSSTVLQTTTSAANAVGQNKILIAVTQNVADEDTNKAIFQVMGGEGQGVLVTADNIAADTVTANEVAANTITAAEIAAETITASEIAALTITGAKIAAQTLTADKLNIGDVIFDTSDGLLLLGPPLKITQEGSGASTANYWYDKRGSKGRIGGAGATYGARGTVHLVQGRWPESKALVVEPAAINYITNPSFETGTTGWTAYSSGAAAGTRARSSVRARFGDYSYLLTKSGGAEADRWGTRLALAASVADRNYVASAWVWLGPGAVATVGIAKAGGVGAYQESLQEFTSPVQQWVRVVTDPLVANATGDNMYAYLWITGTPTVYAYFDGVQVEWAAYATTYCDGDQGEGYDWSGTAHDSTSSRKASYVLLDDHAGLVNENATLSFRCVVQAPYDYDAEWAQAYAALFDCRDGSNANRIMLYYVQATNSFGLYLNNGERITWATDAFSAGDWLDIVVTIDFTNDDYILYFDGVEVDTDDTALSATTITEWAVGARYDGDSSWGCWAHAEHAVFDRVLTAVEVAQLFNLQRPLIDTGATAGPGIYILDGQFRVQSSQTGNRIEITADEIAGYDAAGTKQFYLQSSDGKAVAGAGVVELDADGIEIAISTAAADPRSYKFELSGVVFSGLWAYAADAFSHVINLQANSIASRSPTIGIYSNAPATTPAYISIKALSSADFAQILLTADSDAAVKKKIDFYGEQFDFNGKVYALSYSTDDGTTRWKLGARSVGAIVSVDGYVEVDINGTTYKLLQGTF